MSNPFRCFAILQWQSILPARGTAMRVLPVALAVFACVAPAIAQDYPRKPVRVVAPFAPGGATDLLARLVSQKLSERWGQSVLVDNRTGAGGHIGAEVAARSTPDGYTLLV